MTKRTEHNSLVAKAFSIYVGDWKAQSILYGITFFVALAAALIADLVLRQSESFAAVLAIVVVAAFLFLTPLLRAWLLSDSIAVDYDYVSIHQELVALIGRVNELAALVDASSRPFEIALNLEAAKDLELLRGSSHAQSIIHYLRDLVYSDSRLQLLSGSQPGAIPRTIALPAEMKILLDRLAKTVGFVSGEAYLEFILKGQASRLRETEERKKQEKTQELEQRRLKIIATPHVGMVYREQLLDPSSSAERLRLNVELPTLFQKTR